jgi:hypothetical protein
MCDLSVHVFDFVDKADGAVIVGQPFSCNSGASRGALPELDAQMSFQIANRFF